MLQDIVLNKIGTQFFIDEVKKSKYTFSDTDLAYMAYHFTRNLDDRVDLLKQIYELTDDNNLKDMINKAINGIKEEYSNFIKPEENAIFEACIKETPSSWEERYLCKTYEGALKRISLFFEFYRIAIQNDSSWFYINKRIAKDCNTVEEFIEDEIGSMTLLKGLVIQDVKYYPTREEKDKNSDEYGFLNIEIKYPEILNNFDIVKYNRGGEVNFAINIINFSINDLYLIPLDEDYYDEEDLEFIWDSHLHTELPLIEKISYDQLSEKLKINYDKIVNHIQKLVEKGEFTLL